MFAKVLTLIALVIYLATNPASSSPAKKSNAVINVPVVSVTDGDTFTVMINDVKTKVRLIGIDAPETHDPRKPVECLGKEASQKLNSLLQGRVVSLTSDPTQANIDRYGRLLRYASLEDGTDVGHILIGAGFAFEYTYNYPYQKQTEYKSAQQVAQQTQAGLWNPTICNSKKD